MEVCIEGAETEDSLWADQPPDDGRIEEDATVGAVEFVGLVFGTDVGDGATECPAEDGDLYDGGPEGGDGLGHEHGTPGNFHVHAELKILGEVEALGHGNVAIRLEEHHCNRATGLDVSRDELARICQRDCREGVRVQG